MNDEKFLSRLSSRDRRYNSSKQGEGSFRVLYYGGATGSVPFLWESQPGMPKHKFSDGAPLPPLTPPPQYMSSHLASPSLKKKSHSKILGSIFTRTPSKKSSAPTSPTSSSSSSRSSSYSLPSTPFHSSSRARLRSKMEFGVGEDEYEEGADSPTSTLCFRGGNGSCSRRNNKGYDFFYPVKKVVKSIVGGLRS